MDLLVGFRRKKSFQEARAPDTDWNLLVEQRWGAQTNVRSDFPAGQLGRAVRTCILLGTTLKIMNKQ